MEKMKMHSMDIVNDNVQKIGNMFPECITEIIGDGGTVKKVVDFSILNQLFDYNTINNPSTGGGKGKIPIYMARQIKGKGYCEPNN